MEKAQRTFDIVPEIAYREIADTIAIVHPTQNRLLTLNDTAVFLWRELAQGLSVGQIAEKMSRTFEVDASEALRDCLSYVDLLVERGLVIEADRQQP